MASPFNSQPRSTAGASGAPLNSPAFTGTPTAPTPAPGTNTTQLATTAFVAAAGGVALTKAAASDVRVGTDDAKYVTSKAMSDAMAIPTSTGSGSWAPDLSGVGGAIERVANGASTLAAPLNPVVGRTYAFILTQDATGGRTWAFNAVFDFGAAGAPTVSTVANRRDLVTALCLSSTLYLASFRKGAA